MEVFNGVKDMVYCEIDEISRIGKLDMNTMKILGELVDILKDIGSIEMFEEGVQVQEDGEYSANGYSRGGGYSQRKMPVYYGDGNSYRGRSYNSGYSRGGRNYSYDGSKAHMIDKLNHLMMEANDQKDKDAIQHLIDQMENS